MDNKKNFNANLLLIILAPVFIAAGILLVVLPQNSRLAALGYALMLIGAYLFIMWLIRVLALRSVNKEKRQAEHKALLKKQAREKFIETLLQAFETKPNRPETNTIEIVNAGIEYFAKGRYVCEKDFKGISGYHFAFEITSTDLKYMPDDYDDVCDLRGTGILVAVGYHDDEALEKYANDNGVILQDTVQNSIGQMIKINSDDGYVATVWTVDGDEIDYGFVKILECKNDVLTVYFSLYVPDGLCDTVDGVVELKKDTGEKANDINSLITRIKHAPYNTVKLSAEEIETIKQENPFLPESYVTFLTEIGLADLDWVDVGLNDKTPTNLDDDEVTYLKEILASYKDYNLDDFYFIGVDCDATYYAFSKKDDDKKVYIFSNDASDIGTYENFEEFLAGILNAK